MGSTASTPTTRTPLRKLVDDAITGRSSYSIELRIVRADGTVSWIHSRGAFMPDPMGGPGRMVGTAQDITDRKRGHLPFSLVIHTCI